MKIFCTCSFCNRKIYLTTKAKTRQELSNNWGISFSVNCSYCQSKNQVNINFVNAESSYVNLPLSTTIGGGLIGILAGPIGIIIGLGVGGVSGGLKRYNDKQDVKYFNNNYL